MSKPSSLNMSNPQDMLAVLKLRIQQMKQLEELQQSLFSSSDPMRVSLLTDTDLIIRYTGSNSQKLLGFDSLDGKKLDEIISDKSNQELSGMIEEVRKFGHRKCNQIFLIGKNNTNRAFYASAELLTDEKNKEPIGYTFVFLEEDLRNKAFVDSTFRDVVEKQAELVCRVDLVGNITFVNQAYCNFYGKKREELIGSGFLDLVPPESRKASLKIVEKIKTGKYTKLEFEHRVRTGSDEPRWVEWSTGPILDENGNVVELQSVGRDITNTRKLKIQQQMVEDRLEVQKQFYEDMLNRTDTEIVVFDADHRYMFVNPIAIQNPEVREWIIGKDDFDYCRYRNKDISLAQHRRAIFNQAVASKKKISWEEEAGPEDNRRVMMRTMTPKFNKNGELEYVFAYGFDITERKKDETLLEQSRLELMQSQEIARMGSWRMNIALAKMRWSDNLHVIMDRPASEFADSYQNFINAIHDADRVRVETLFSKCIREKEPFSTEFDIVKRDGTVLPVFTQAFLIEHASGKSHEIVGITQDISHLKQLENKLTDQKKFLYKIIDANPNIIFVKNEDLEFVIANKAQAEMYGVKIPELLGKRDRDFARKTDEVDFFEKMDRQVIETRKPTGLFEEKSTHPVTGEERWYEVNKVPIFTADGAIHILGVASDITERKKADDALKESEKRYRSVVENISEVIFQIDLNGCWSYLNPAWEEISEFSISESLGKPFHKYIFEGDKERSKKIFEPIVLQEKSWSREEVRYVSKSGAIRWAEVFVNPVYSESGKLTGFSGTINDVTDRREAEQERQKFVSLVENSSDIILITDTERNLIYANPAGREVFEIGMKENVAPVLLEEIYDNETGDIVKSGFDEILKTGQTHELEFRHVEKKSGESLDLQQSMFLVTRNVKNGSGPEVICVALILKDITEKNRYLEALESEKNRAEEANRAKTEFLANVSHEIRTPMNSILGFTELLRTQIKNDQERKYLEAIMSSGKSLLMIINDILDLSKIESGRMDLEYHATEMEPLLDEVLSVFSLQAAQKNIELVKKIEKNVPPVLIMDDVRFRQILINLVGNAVKFTGEGHVKIEISTLKSRKKTDQVDLLVTVEDTGIGIPEDQHALIFESFRQQSGQSTRMFGGTGLGLAITKRLSEKMGGSILVSSEPGKGSRFEVTLKDVEIAATAAPVSDMPLNELSEKFEPALILVVDDIQLNRELLREYLVPAGLKAIEAADGREALDKINQNNVDLVLMDIKMPVMDGFEAVKHIRRNPETSGLPVLALTASVFFDAEAEPGLNDFDSLLRKPVSRGDVLMELKKYLKTVEASDEKSRKKSSDHSKVKRKSSADSDNDYQISEEFYQRLKAIGSRVERTRQSMIISDVEEVAEALIQLGMETKSRVLSSYGDELLTSVRNFDIEELISKLNNFDRLVRQFKATNQSD